MTDHKTGTREEWQAAREALLRREKEHTRMADELARRRREQDSRDGSRADGDTRARRRILVRRGRAHERDGHGRCDPARLVRVLCRPVGADGCGDDAAGRVSGSLETRSCQRSCARRAAIRRVVPRRLGHSSASRCIRCIGPHGPQPITVTFPFCFSTLPNLLLPGDKLAPFTPEPFECIH
jgi:Bacterial protein of unknown function (DUF899)